MIVPIKKAEYRDLFKAAMPRVLAACRNAHRLLVICMLNEARLRRKEVPMGDRSPKSRQRDEKQKSSAKGKAAAVAKTKQDSHSFGTLTPKGRK